MKVEIRRFPQNDGSVVKRLLLVAEEEHESRIIDEVMGSSVSEGGLIATGICEVRLADGHGEHYLTVSHTLPITQEAALAEITHHEIVVACSAHYQAKMYENYDSKFGLGEIAHERLSTVWPRENENWMGAAIRAFLNVRFG